MKCAKKHTSLYERSHPSLWAPNMLAPNFSGGEGMKMEGYGVGVRWLALSVSWTVLFLCAIIFNGTPAAFSAGAPLSSGDAYQATSANKLFLLSRQIFRVDTFGDQAFWGDTLQLQKAIEGAQLGGVGKGISPTAALGLGLKAGSAALPKSL